MRRKLVTTGGYVSEGVRQLVETVERLGTEDQDRILRIVTLLAVVPQKIQTATQTKLKQLVADNPDSPLDCIAGVDDVIKYLERNVLTAEEPESVDTPYACSPLSHRCN